MRPQVETNSGLSAVLRGVVADLQHASGADIVSIFLYEEATHTYYAPFATGQPQESLLDSLADMREQLARYLADADQGKVPDELGVHQYGSTVWLTVTRQRLVARNAPSEIDSTFIRRYQVQSTIGLPLVAADRLLGLVYLNYRSREHAPDDSKLRELERRAATAPQPVSFDGVWEGSAVAVIAEVKRRSPSAGAIREDLDAVGHARAYVRGGAVAISVLTDAAHFGGSLDDLAQVARGVAVPVLCKDFILHELQLIEARGAGASGALLIVRALDSKRLRALAWAARGLGLAPLVEVHTEGELEQALGAEPAAVGVNSRDLATFAVDLSVAERLVARVPAGVPAVAESGIETRADVERMAAAGADLVLVGTSVARRDDPETAVRALVGVPRQGRRA